jgi:serine protease Do
VNLPDIVAPLIPAVVNISILKQRTAANGRIAHGGEEMDKPLQEYGSGFIIDPTGFIVTNRHVIDGAYKVTVTLDDNAAYPATVLSANMRPDLALLKIDAARPLPSVKFGNSDVIRIGQTVIAIGNPLGLSSSISVGVISAINRDVNQTMIDDFIQTDAAINHGNSGGPLFNLAGEVIGVNWALVAPVDKAGSVGLGLAIPSDDAAFVVDQMRRFGHFRAGYLGVRVQQLIPELSSALGLFTTQGGIITSVRPGSPAERAGLREGDVILRFGDREVTDVRALLREMGARQPGETATMLTWRAGQTRWLTVTMDAWPKDANEFDPVGPPVTADRGPRMSHPDLGLRLGRAGGAAHGVVILGVAANSIAADGGLSAGDIILSVQDTRVATPEEVHGQFEALRREGRDAVVLLVQSGDRPRWIAVPLQEPR